MEHNPLGWLMARCPTWQKWSWMRDRLGNQQIHGPWDLERAVRWDQWSIQTFEKMKFKDMGKNSLTWIWISLQNYVSNAILMCLDSCHTSHVLEMPQVVRQEWLSKIGGLTDLAVDRTPVEVQLQDLDNLQPSPSFQNIWSWSNIPFGLLKSLLHLLVVS